MNIGKKIKSLRKSKGLTQKQLAERIDKSEISIRKYEAGDTNIPLDILFKIAHVLEIDAPELVGMQRESMDYIEAFKQYLEAKDYFITDINLIDEIENHISEYIKFKMFENKNSKV